MIPSIEDLEEHLGIVYQLEDSSYPHSQKEARCDGCEKNTQQWLHVIDSVYYVVVCSKCGFYQKYSESDWVE